MAALLKGKIIMTRSHTAQSKNAQAQSRHQVRGPITGPWMYLLASEIEKNRSQ